jgi:hypothetical protein
MQPRYNYVLPKPLGDNPALPDTIVKGMSNRTAVKQEKPSWITIPPPVRQTVRTPAQAPAKTPVTVDGYRREIEKGNIIRDLGRAAAIKKNDPGRDMLLPMPAVRRKGIESVSDIQRLRIPIHT